MPGSKNTIGSINTSVFNIVFMNLMNSPSDFIKKLLFQKKTLVASSTETKILRNITLSEQCKTYKPFIYFPSLQTLITQDTELLPLSHVYQGLIRLNEWKKGYIALLFKNTSLLPKKSPSLSKLPPSLFTYLCIWEKLLFLSLFSPFLLLFLYLSLIFSLTHSLFLPSLFTPGFGQNIPPLFFLSHFSSCFSGHCKFPMPYLGYPSSNIPTVPVLVVGFQAFKSLSCKIKKKALYINCVVIFVLLQPY